MAGSHDYNAVPQQPGSYPDMGDAFRDQKRMLRRVDLAMLDLREAAAFAIELEVAEKWPEHESNRLRCRALQIAMVVAYGRIFAESRSSSQKTMSKRLPKGIIGGLSPNYRRTHDRLIRLRGQTYAHTDAGAIGMSSVKTFNGRIRATARAYNDPFTPFTQEFVADVRGLLGVLSSELDLRSRHLADLLPLESPW